MLVKEKRLLEIILASDDVKARRKLAKEGISLDKLVTDSDWCVRKMVAKNKFALDVLINDKDARVRLEVAQQDYGIHKLVNDENELVRKLATEKLNNYQKKSFFAIEVLDRLMQNSCYTVKRAIVAEGYGLERLAKDTDPRIAKMATRKLRENSSP